MDDRYQYKNCVGCLHRRLRQSDKLLTKEAIEDLNKVCENLIKPLKGISHQELVDEIILLYPDILLDHYPDSPRYNLAPPDHCFYFALYKDNAKEKIEWYKLAYALDPEITHALFNLAAVYCSIDDPEKAIEHFEKVITTYPKHKNALLYKEAHFRLGIIYWRIVDDLEKALAYFKNYRNLPLTDKMRDEVEQRISKIEEELGEKHQE